MRDDGRPKNTVLFTFMTHAIAQLSDADLLNAVARAATDERRATAELLRLLAELDARRLYLGAGFSSLFTYCTQVLHLSEHAAYHRIEAARAVRQFPIVLDLLSQGALTLTTVALLRPHLTMENHERLLAAARYRTKRDVEHQIACLAPEPDVKPLVRKLQMRTEVDAALGLLSVVPSERTAPGPMCVVRSSTEKAPRTVIRPTAPERYLVKVTVSAETHAKLRRAQDLLSHTIPNGDHAAILDRALTLLVDQLERQKIGLKKRVGATPRPRGQAARSTVPVKTRHLNGS